MDPVHPEQIVQEGDELEEQGQAVAPLDLVVIAPFFQDGGLRRDGEQIALVVDTPIQAGRQGQ